MSEALLEVADIHGGYGAIRVLHGVSMTVTKGSITALIGGNGAGKTTLMNTIMGALPASSGRVAFAGSDLADSPTSKRVDLGMALVPEGRLVFPLLSVEENLRLGAIAPRARRDHARRREEVFELFPRLRERRRQSAGTLSGGEQQMLALGRGLMARPDLLLLDEPTLGLAPLMAKLLFDTILRLRDRGLTILLAEQDVPRALRAADYGYVLENGKVSLTGPAPELLKNPMVREAYLGM